MADHREESRQDSPRWDLELLALAEAVVNDEASAEQIDRLAAMLEKDESARSLYLDYIDIHAELRRRYLSPEDENEAHHDHSARAENPSSRLPGITKAGWTSALLFLAASLAIMVAIPFGLSKNEFVTRDKQAERADKRDLKASVNGVAVLSRLVDAQWSDSTRAYVEGAPLPTGEISIESGLLQIDFYCGAIAVLEGPASMELLSTDRAALTSGKLRARVPTRARGFTIVTSSGEVVDLGTEFAVEAPQGQQTGELHVIDGEVRFHPSDSRVEEPVLLQGGEAVWIGGVAPESPPRDATGRFVGPTEVESLARRKHDLRREAWEDHRERLLRDPHLVALYAYSPQPQWSRLFRNYAPNAGDDTHGAVIGAEWVEGRWPGHKALRFGNPSHRVSISLQGRHESITLSTWVKIDRLHATNSVALMHPEEEQDRVLFWTLDRVPTGAVLHFAESVEPRKLADRKHYSSVRQGVFNSDLGKWMHLAVTYNKQTRRLSHYCDGTLVGWKPISLPRELSIGSADLGNWPYKDWAKGTEFEMRNLIGRMDEFMVFSRALSHREIQEIFETGVQ